MAALAHQRLTVIKLSGSLAKRFGRTHHRQLDTGTTAEAMAALRATLDGFEQFILDASRKGLRYAIFRNRENINESMFGMSGTREIRIVPVIAGSKSGGFFQTVLGVALIAVASIATGGFAGIAAGGMWGAVGAVGISLAAGGVMQMLSPQPGSMKSREDPDNASSYAFGGPVNTTAAGNPVGLLYGMRRIGGAVISAGVYIEDASSARDLKEFLPGLKVNR